VTTTVNDPYDRLLGSVYTWSDDLSFRISSLDDPGIVPPMDHTGMADAAYWDAPGHGLPLSLDVRPA
jgi:hypothetical protein